MITEKENYKKNMKITGNKKETDDALSDGIVSSFYNMVDEIINSLIDNIMLSREKL